ncbi:MAG: hypothetical protein WKF70_01040 [Chitinophagaceae bacterium]
MGLETLWKSGLTAKNILTINGAISEQGEMKGQVSISSHDYAKLSRLATAKKGKEAYIEKYVTPSNPNLMVDDVVFENIDSDTLPLKQVVKFSQRLSAAGEYQYFSANILTGLETNPFIAENRFSDIFFGFNQSFTILGHFTLPENYEFDVLPKNIKMRLSDTSIVISRMAQVTQNVLQTKIQLDFSKPVYPATQYAELQQFYAQLQELLNEQFVVRKKVKA